MIRSKLRPPRQGSSRSFSSSTLLHQYENTINNLKIGKHTRVIFQGFTGRQATSNAKESIAWGTHIVGGVTPGKSAEHLGLPVLPTVKDAMRDLKPDATGIYVAAHQAAAAIEEAIEAEVPLVVAVAEHLPLHDVLRIHSILKTQSKTRLVGANSPGIISSIGKCRIGFQPLPCFSPGRVGIVAKSGTLSYEAVASTTRAGLGQSLCIGMGGDLIAGTNFVDALKVFENDNDTEGIVLIGEIGGAAELEAAAWIKDYVKRTPNPKPISAIVAGVQVGEKADPAARAMGHAGAFTVPSSPTVQEKIRHLEEAGVTMVNHPAKFGSVMKSLLGHVSRSQKTSNSVLQQQRAMHTLTRSVRSHASYKTSDLNPRVQVRSLYVDSSVGLDMLRSKGVSTADSAEIPSETKVFTVTFDRSSRCPAILIRGSAQAETVTFPFDYRMGPSDEQQKQISQQFSPQKTSFPALKDLIQSVWSLYKEKEAFLLEMTVVEDGNDLTVVKTRFGFDDAAFRSAKRQKEVHQLRQVDKEDPLEVEAEKNGIVYVKLSGEGNIGTLVNGAGLAMNTLDALADAGGSAANFLDTGGKATSETVKKSFQLILQDSRVKVIFVNIFGGLTLGDMIANGILLAFKELQVSVPVVVRIRGTNEEEGQRIIAESGLPLFAFDDFEEAAAKAIDLARV